MQQKRGGSRPVSRVLSRTVIPLGRSSPNASSDLPGSRAGHASAPLFGLAPDGVYRAAVCCHPRGALLPHLFTLTCARRPSAVRFLWHFPSAHAAQALPGTLPYGARTFLRAVRHSDCPADFPTAVYQSRAAWARQSVVRAPCRGPGAVRAGGTRREYIPCAIDGVVYVQCATFSQASRTAHGQWLGCGLLGCGLLGCAFLLRRQGRGGPSMVRPFGGPGVHWTPG